LGSRPGLLGPDAVRRLTVGDCGPAGDPPPEAGLPITREIIRSRYVSEPVEVSICFPPGHVAGTPVPVCFCLPGRGARGRDVFRVFRIHDAMVAALARGGASFAVVGVDGGESYWHKRASGEDRMAMLEKEVIPRTEDRHLLGAEGAGRAIMGWSMGGYGALRAAQRNPTLFEAVVAVSPALWLRHQDAVADAFDGPDDYRRNDVFDAAESLRGMAVHVDCGASDPFVNATREFIRRLPTPPVGGIADGCHNDDYWLRVASGQIDTLGRALA
jgi:enterochelin esterase-like enzyme